jgi:flagellar motor switch protein FliN/FliY
MSDAAATHDSLLEPDALLDVPMRFWAELGRAKMPIGRAVALAEGSIVDLDRKPEEAVDVFLNGAHFGTGRLILVDGEWALQLETVDPVAGLEQASTPSSDTA